MDLLARMAGLTPASTPERSHAHELLAAHGLPVLRVVAVDVDSILYVTRDRVARTAWLTVRGTGVAITDRPGFQSEM